LTRSHFLHVKIAGGAAAQALGLINGIYASTRLGIPFKVSYYPYSTGTYWPFAISHLLENHELLNVAVSTKGLDESKDYEIGKIISSHPLMSKKFSYEGALGLIKQLKLETVLNFLRRELVIRASPKRLTNVNKFYKSISGGFASINDPFVNKKLHQRFIKSGVLSPFSGLDKENDLVVIHYRLGDKRAVGKHPYHFNTDLIIDPQSYADILHKISKSNSKKIYVVSDDPILAKKLLSTVGIAAKIHKNTGDIWEDINFMSRANIFIGSNSQVSQFVNICVENNGGKSFILNFFRDLSNNNFLNTNYFPAKFLDLNHNIYTLDFKLDKDSHCAYRKK